MLKKTWVTAAVLIVCFSFLSCKENTRVAVLVFDRGPGVPDSIALSARTIAVERIMKKKKIDVISTGLIDQKMPETGARAMLDKINAGQSLGANIIVVGTISPSNKEVNFIDNIKGNTAWYDIEVSSIDVMNGTVIKSFSGTYDAKMNKLSSHVKKLKIGGGGGLRWWWWVIIGIVIVCIIVGVASSDEGERFLYGTEGQKKRRRKKAIKDIMDIFD